MRQEPRPERLVEGNSRSGSPIMRRRELKFEGQDVRRVEPRIGMLHPNEAPDQQAGADKQNERRRHLEHDHRLAEPGPPGGGAARGLPERVIQTGAGRQRGNQTEEDARDDETPIANATTHTLISRPVTGTRPRGP